VTPGPVFTTATFIGYLIGGVPGALLATLGIFLPSFLYVAVLFPFVHRIRGSRLLSALMDGINASAVGLMAAATLILARAAVVDPFTAAITLASLLVITRYRLNATWLVVGSGLAGVLAHVVYG
jgi:chromate transporter